MLLISVSSVTALLNPYSTNTQNNSSLVENNLNINFEGYTITNTTRLPIVFGEPVKWIIYLSDGIKIYDLYYTTPAINRVKLD